MLERLLTARAGWTVTVAIAVLVAVGRVKPVRAGRTFTRQLGEKLGLVPPRPEELVEAVRLPVPEYRPPSWSRRLLSLTGVGVLGVTLGLVITVLLGGSAIWLVGTLTGRLK
jgi:hypothetical protein